MAQLNPESRFQSWKLSEAEFFQGAILTSLQKQVIQNQICDLATQKINLEFDPAAPLVFMQAEAGVRGQILALEYLITLSSEAEKQFDPGLQKIHIQDSESNPGQSNLPI